MSEVRVLQVLGRSAGGIARHVALLTESLDGSNGLTIDVAGPSDLPPVMPKAHIALDIPDGAIKGHRAALRSLRELIVDNGYGVVHGHGLRASIDSALAARRTHARPVATVHNLVQPEIAGARARLYRRAEPIVVGLNQKVFAPSEEIARHLRAAAPARATA